MSPHRQWIPCAPRCCTTSIPVRLHGNSDEVKGANGQVSWESNFGFDFHKGALLSNGTKVNSIALRWTGEIELTAHDGDGHQTWSTVFSAKSCRVKNEKRLDAVVSHYD
jgi:hypothetical protein